MLYRGMRIIIIAACIALTGCASTSAGLYETAVRKTVDSSKNAQQFATCAVENFAGDAQLRSEGERYWIIRMVMDVPRHRWDFTPTATGSKAELRSTGLAGSGDDKVQGCA